MALNSPAFHDGLNYDGKELRSMIAAIVGDRQGVAGDSGSLAVTAQTSPNNTVKVAAGTAVILATAAGLFGSYAVLNDASLTSPAITATGAQVRTDRLVLRVTAGVPALEIIAGTAGSASPPAITGDNVIPLAQIVLPVSTSNVTNAMIVDERQFLPAGVTICTSTTRPTNQPVGRHIYEVDTKRLKVWDGTVWRAITPHGGQATGSANGSGQAIIAHGLGYTPTQVTVVGGDGTGLPYNVTTIYVQAVDATNITFRLNNGTTGGALASNPYNFWWTAR